MRITQQEVKTIYSIEFGLEDFTKIYLGAKNDPCLLGAFDEFDLDDTSMETIRKHFNGLGNSFKSGTSKQLQYIVRKLGFDGIENYGYNKELMNGKKVHRMTVYNYGEVYL